jgi:predicted outer membrane protein
MWATHAEVRATIVLVVTVASALTIAACGRDEGSGRRAQRAAVVRDTGRAASDTNESGGDVVGDWVESPVKERWITDGNIVALLNAMAARQIVAADVELEGWHNDTVRAFAASMAREHAELQRSVDSLTAQLRLTPIAPALAKPWLSALQAQIDSMRRSGRLDRAFVHQQATAHELMGGYVEQLTAGAQDPALQSFLAATGKRFGSERDRSRSLEAGLAKADSAAAARAATLQAKQGVRAPMDR